MFKVPRLRRVGCVLTPSARAPSSLRPHRASPSLSPAPPVVSLTRTRPEANPESVMSVLAGLASALPYRSRHMRTRQWW